MYLTSCSHMNIVILSGSFYPSIHPRAFRATELAKEFVRNGHHVTEISCKTIKEFDYEEYSRNTGIEIIKLDVFRRNRVAEVASHKQTVLYSIKRFLIEYLLCGNLYKYSKEISTKLSKLDCWDNADLVIVLSTPFPCHYGFYKFVKKREHFFVTIFDSGDPFYYSKQTNRAIWFKYIEKNVYKYCDFLTIPTANAIHLYSPLIPEDKIKIIPQGFNMRDLNLYKGEFGIPVKMAYAGVFYWDIRNPEFLFEALENSPVDYEFYLFMRYKDGKLEEVLEKYPRLKSQMHIHLCVPHDDLISELSKMHFLINIENLSNTQMPSKLIDYGMTGRPVLSCNEKNFELAKLERFLHGDYTGQYEVNIDEYNIELIAKKFINLYKKSNAGA